LISFTVNGKPVTVEDPPSTPLLWVIRDSLKLTGTKFGCGMALCGGWPSGAFLRCAGFAR
jgi:isoquinoline 1-oxidoreductase subunit alpha